MSRSKKHLHAKTVNAKIDSQALLLWPDSKAVPFSSVILTLQNSCVFAKSKNSSPYSDVLNSIGPLLVVLINNNNTITNNFF